MLGTCSEAATGLHPWRRGFIGVLARFLKPGRDRMGCILTILLGIAGACRRLRRPAMLGGTSPVEPAGFIAAWLGAIVILVLCRLFRAASASALR